jgi:FkbM family methyltransferase
MSRFDRAAGLVRSLAIYHAVPLRQRRMRRLYAHFVGPGDLVFDVGAHVGNRTRALASLGCRVVAIEPQPDFARVLRMAFARSGRVEIIEAAVGDKSGRAQLSVSDRTPTVTTMAGGWRDARAREPDFEHVRWNRQLEVETTTLDLLIARLGLPSFVKIDVEGSELTVLAGLNHPVRVLSFEYLPRALEQVHACAQRLMCLGRYRFNWSPGESYVLAERAWINERELLANLGSSGARRGPGDVYARLIG